MNDKKISIKILRGVHVPENITEIVNRAKNSDVILLEFVGTKKVRDSVLEVIDLVLSNQNFVEELEKDTSKKNTYINSFHTKIAWELRLSEKFIFLVDKNDCKNDEEVQSYIPGNRLNKAFDDILLLIKDRFNLVERLLDKEYEMINFRDLVTVKQTEHIINALAESQEFKSRESIKISLVVGFLHNIAEELKVTPDIASIIDEVYGEDTLNKVKQEPAFMLLAMKVKLSGGLVGNKFINYYLLYVLTKTIKLIESSNTDNETDLGKIIHRGGVPDFLKNESVHKAGIKDIDSYDEKELDDTVSELLAQLNLSHEQDS